MRWRSSSRVSCWRCLRIAALAVGVTEKNAKTTHDNKLLKIEKESRLIDMRNRLASRIAKSMGTTAALRLLALQTKHAYKKADGSVIIHSFNGEAMFEDLVKLLDEVETDRDVKKHLKNVEKASRRAHARQLHGPGVE